MPLGVQHATLPAGHVLLQHEDHSTAKYILSVAREAEAEAPHSQADNKIMCLEAHWLSLQPLMGSGGM